MLGVFMVAILALGQAPAARDGAITGQIVDGVSGKPVGAAIVSIAGTGLTGRAGPAVPPPMRILTGSDGRFAFRGLALGSFTITASRNGYAEGASGRRRPGGASQAIVLSAAQRSADVAVRMWKNGALAGTVIDDVGEPVVGVRVVALQRTSTFGRPQFVPTAATGVTDDRGAYRFSNLTAGDYIVLVTPPVVSLKMSVFEEVARTGRAVGDLGAAMPVGGVNNMLFVGDAIVPLGRGTAMPPTSRRGRLQIYPPTLHPAATAVAQATVITLAIGEERTGLDVQLTPVTTAQVSGTLLGPAGPAGQARVQLVPARADELVTDLLASTSISDPTGAFVFAAVVPGQYSLRATQFGPPNAGNQLHWVDMPITVGGDDITGVTAVLAPPLRITARMQFDGNAERPAPPQSGRFTNAFSLEPADGPAGPMAAGIAGTVAEGGALTLAGYRPGRYRVRVANSPQGWMFKSAMLNGVDVSETPFDFTRDVPDLVLNFTDRWSGISGSVQGAGADGATVVVFTTDTQAWQGAGGNPRRLRSARAASNGQFGISSLPPGDYYVTAIREEDAADWRDPATLEALARGATQIAILEGEHRTVDVTVRGVRR